MKPVASQTPQNGKGAGTTSGTTESVEELPDTLPASPEELRKLKATPLNSPAVPSPVSSTSVDSSPTGDDASLSLPNQVT